MLRHLSVPFPLSVAVVHVEDVAELRAALDDACGAWLAESFEDEEEVGELGFVCNFGEEGAQDGAVFNCLGGALGSDVKYYTR